LLPYLEQEKLYRKIDFTRPIDDKANEDARKTVVATFVNPDDKAEAPAKDPTKRYGPTNYLFNGLIFYHNSRPRFPASFTDGTSNTIIVAETLRGDGSRKAADVKRQYVALAAADAAKYRGRADQMGVQEFKEGKFIAGDRGASWMDGRFL